MAGTKVEVKMKKAEPGSWSKLFFPREVSSSLVNLFCVLDNDYFNKFDLINAIIVFFLLNLR